MELRVVDPKTLLDNPENPRTSAPNVAADRRLAHNIKVVGLLQAPLVRELPDGQLMIVAGHRRRRACVLAKMREMHVIVTSADEKLDGLAAGSENIIREAMTQSEQWRFVDKARRDKSHTDAQIARALMVTPAYLKRLSLLAGLHEPILHAIDMGRGPDFNDLKVIAAAPVEEQRAAWAEMFEDMVEDDADPAEYRLNAEDPEDVVPWRDLARFLKQTRYMAVDARFDEPWPKPVAWSGPKTCLPRVGRITALPRMVRLMPQHRNSGWLIVCPRAGSSWKWASMNGRPPQRAISVCRTGWRLRRLM